MSLSYTLSDDKPTQSDKSLIYGLRGFFIGETGQIFQGLMLWREFNQINSEAATTEQRRKCDV